MTDYTARAPQQRRPFRPRFPGRMKEQRTADYAATPAQLAGATARRIIRELGLPDSRENWRALSTIVLDAILPEGPELEEPQD